ncbi:MAG: hypothetical protein HY207_01735 [Nitrospirae bacterium]|nr:hypothetical protein [Nitrospirota bacterium]
MRAGRAAAQLGLAAPLLAGLLGTSAPADEPAPPPTDPLLINQIVIDPKHPNVLYTAGRPVGVLKSMDRGLTWLPARNGLRNTSAYHLVVDPTHPDVLYVGTYGGGVYQTRDGAKTWVPVNTGLGNTNIYALALDPSRPQRLIVSTSTGDVFETRDRGAAWTGYGQSLPVQPGEVIATLLFRAGLLYLGQETLFQRGPRDPAWRPVSDGLKDAVITTLTFDRDGTLYAGTRHDGLFRSPNVGRTWTRLGAQFEHRWVRQVVAGPPGSRRLTVSVLGQGLFRSDDGGAAWRRLEAGLPQDNIEALAVDPADPDRIYAGTHDHGLFYSVDGGDHWRRPDRVVQEPVQEIIAALAAGEARPADAVAPASPPPAFAKCNQCHGWAEAPLNQTNTYWRVAPNRRNWAPTVTRMAPGAGLTSEEAKQIIEFLMEYTGRSSGPF